MISTAWITEQSRRFFDLPRYLIGRVLHYRMIWFRAIVAAAMTLLMDGTKVGRDEAAREVARRLAKMGCKHSSGKSITGPQISKWREKMMTERAAENQGVARYQHTLQLVSGMPSPEAVALILDSLTLAVHAPELAVKPDLQIFRRHRRSLLLRLEHTYQPAVEDHVHRLT